MATDRLRKKISKGRHKSSIKRVRQAKKRHAKNRHALSKMKTAIKSVRATKSPESLKIAIPIIAKTAAKGIVHHRTASRLISRLTRSVVSPAK